MNFAENFVSQNTKGKYSEMKQLITVVDCFVF